MLADSSVDVLPQGSVTTLTSPVRRGLTHTECVQFWYHTGGDNPGKKHYLICVCTPINFFHVNTEYLSSHRHAERLCEAI